jgi:hypothetical protein
MRDDKSRSNCDNTNVKFQFCNDSCVLLYVASKLPLNFNYCTTMIIKKKLDTFSNLEIPLCASLYHAQLLFNIYAKGFLLYLLYYVFLRFFFQIVLIFFTLNLLYGNNHLIFCKPCITIGLCCKYINP